MLRVSLLGGQAIRDDRTGRARPVSSRAGALMSLLVCRHGAPQSRQLIAGLFWPDSTNAQALTNLRRELHHLRLALGEEPSLVVTPKDLRWHDSPTCRVDVRVFSVERTAALAAAAAGDDREALARASAAVAEYGGDLLPGVYDDWVLDARSELERQCVDLCDLVAAARERTGDLAGAADAMRRRVRMQPLEEAGYRTLMRLQAELGDRAGAVSTYHHCASVLERELGVPPDEATREAFGRLMASSHPAGPAVAAGEAPLGGLRLATVPLVGRSRELSLIEGRWRAATAGNPGLLVVRGGAGVGKTRCLAEAAAVAQGQGALVATAQCFGAPGRLALTPVADWLRSPVVRAATATLGPVWRAEVSRLVPSAGYAGGRGSRSPEPGDAWQRHRFFEGVARALLATGRPVLLVLDNLQWCDHETLEFLPFLLRLAPAAPLLVAATLRDDSLSQDSRLADWAVRMRATGLLTDLSLSPLEAAGTARLAEAICGRPLPEADASLLHATTAGFPLFIIEALRSAAGPPAPLLPAGDLGAVLRKRLLQTSPAARDVAGLAAAVGENFTLDLLTEASDLSADAVVDAVDELWRHRIMRELGDGYDFTHDLLREAAYTQVSPPRRWLLHRRVAQALELLHAGDTDPVAASLAEQYARGGRPERALAYYRRAADIAAGMFAHAEAIRLDEKALAIVGGLPAGRDRDSRELAVLEAVAAPLNARHGYASPQLQRALERSVSLAESLGRTGSTVNGMVALWASRFVQGRTADSYRTARRALALTGPDSGLSGPAHFAVGGSAVSLGMPAGGLRHLELAAQLATGAVPLSIGTRPDVHGTAWAAHAHWLLGDDTGATSACRRAVALARGVGHPYSLVVALAYGCITWQLCQDPAQFRDGLVELRELCERYGFGYYREWVLVLDGWSRTDGSGAGVARRGIRNLAAAGAFARMPYWLSLLADLLARDGQPGAARATLDAATAAGWARDDVWWLPEVMRMRAAHDGGRAAVTRLRTAARIAAAHGSLGLLRRCRDDLWERGARPPAVPALAPGAPIGTPGVPGTC